MERLRRIREFEDLPHGSVECGVRSAERKRNGEPTAEDVSLAVHSAFRTPHSALPSARPTQSDLDGCHKVLAWLAGELRRTQPLATLSVEILDQARMELPQYADEL